MNETIYRYHIIPNIQYIYQPIEQNNFFSCIDWKLYVDKYTSTLCEYFAVAKYLNF